MTLINFRAGAQASRSFSTVTAEFSINLLNFNVISADGQEVQIEPGSTPREGKGAVQPKRGHLPGISLFEYPHQVPQASLGIKKIAILVNDCLSDLISGLPALEALRAAHPEAQIALLGHAWHKKFLEGRPGPIDKFIVVPAEASCHDDFYRDMAAMQFDLAIDFGENERAALAQIDRLGAGCTLGCDNSSQCSRLDLRAPYSPNWPKILRYLDIVSLAGASQRYLEPRLDVIDADFREVDAWPQAGIQPLVVLHPGGGEIRLRWPTEKFAWTGKALAEAGARVVVVGSSAERGLTSRVAGQAGAGVLDLGGKLSLNGLTGLISRADLLIGNYSGPLHLAQALGTPTVGIYSSRNFMAGRPLSLSRNRPLVSGEDEEYAQEAEPGKPISLAEDIAAERVVEAALALLEELSPTFKGAILEGHPPESFEAILKATHVGDMEKGTPVEIGFNR